MYKRFWLSCLLDSCYFVTKLSLALILRALYAAFDRGVCSWPFCPIQHRIHKCGHAGKNWKLVIPSHESEALQDKQKLQMPTFSELDFLTFCRFLFKYNYVACFPVGKQNGGAYLQGNRMILEVSEASEPTRQVGDDCRKAANMLAQTSHRESQLTTVL